MGVREISGFHNLFHAPQMLPGTWSPWAPTSWGLRRSSPRRTHFHGDRGAIVPAAPRFHGDLGAQVPAAPALRGLGPRRPPQTIRKRRNSLELCLFFGGSIFNLFARFARGQIAASVHIRKKRGPGSKEGWAKAKHNGIAKAKSKQY